jgi:hypothetical protein
MTENERKQIAEAVAAEVMKAQAANPELDAATIANLKEMANFWKVSKQTAGTTLVVILVTGLAGIFVLGLVAKLKGWVSQ